MYVGKGCVGEGGVGEEDEKQLKLREEAGQLS